MATLTVKQAIDLLVAGIEPLPSETLPLAAARTRTLAEPIIAHLTQPPFTASAMDGYAVHLSDLATLPTTLTIVGESAAGARFHGTLARSQAVRILTGAPVPDGADAIVIQENTRRDGTTLTIRNGAPDPAHIRPLGGDFRQGQRLLEAGQTLDARTLTLAAASGHATVSVRRRPRVAILATGSELVPPGTTPGPDQIVSSNPIGIAALIEAFGGEPVLLGIAPDNLSAIATLIEQARDWDLLITSGGASVGDHDLVRPALESLGVALDFWRIAMRPGNPVLFGRLGPLRVLGVPGNPVSALLCTRIFACPMIGAMLGRPAGQAAPRQIVLGSALSLNGPRQHYMRAVIETRDGRETVSAVPNQDSSLLTPLTRANGLIVRKPNAPPEPAGTPVPVILIDF